VRYRLAAAQYGLRIRLRRPLGDVVGVISLILAVFALVITFGKPSLHLYGEALAAVLIVGIWPAIRYLGSLSMIMRSAAATEEGTAQLFDDMQKGMKNASAYAKLREMYTPLIDEANMSLGEWNWPCRLEFVDLPRSGPASPPSEYASVVLRTSGLADLDSLLGNFRRDPPDSRNAERRARNRQRLMRRWRQLHSHGPVGDEDGRNYCLAQVRIEDEPGPARLVLDVAAVKYGQIARSCEALVNEFALFAFLAGGQVPSSDDYSRLAALMRSSTLLRCMPWRRRTHDSAGSATALFLQPSKRAAGLGVAVVTIVTTAGGQRNVFVGERSGTVGTYPNVLHIVPAGNCNTHGSQRRIERMDRVQMPHWYLRSIMRCEYLEEWFNDEELEMLRIPDWGNRIDQLWAEKVRELIPLKLTGLAFDLLNLRPEVCAMVEVQMSGSEVLNWEFEAGLPPEEWGLLEVGDIEPARIVQSGAGALLLAQAADVFARMRSSEE
jgi:hypothetical protein